MKILLVYSLYNSKTLLKPLNTPEEINFGISYIASLLEKDGHSIRLLVLSSHFLQKSLNLTDKIINEFQPRLIGFTSVASEYPFILKIAKHVRKHHPEIYMVVGGTHVSLNPGKVIESLFDAICVGEGEHPMRDLVFQLENGIQPSGIANMWIKKGNYIEKNFPRPFLKDLDSLPFPNRNMWFEWIEEIPEARFSILLGRGCPFLCTYCCNHALRKLAEGKYVRFRSPNNILEEIRYLHENSPEKREYFFEVETFNVNSEWIFDLCEKLESFNDTLESPLEYGTNFRIGARSDFDNMFSAFAQANIRNLTVGLESGSERVRKEILKRNYSNDDIILMVKSARKHNLNICFQNMIGLPGEREEDFLETIRINRICQPDTYNLNIFFPYPGTELAHHCKEMGLMNNPIDSRMERTIPVLELPSFPIKRIRKRCIWFEYDVYKGKTPIIKLLLGTFRRKMIYFNPVLYNTMGKMPILRKAKKILRRLVE